MQSKKKVHLKMNQINWRCAILTRAGLAIVAAEMLNFCVRNVNRCDHFAIITRSKRLLSQNQITVRYFFFPLVVYSRNLQSFD